MKNKYIFRIKNMASYGLNKYRSFIHSIKCDCGCGGNLLLFGDIDNIIELSTDLLLENGCENTALFLHALDGHMYCVVCMYFDEDEAEENDMEEGLNILLFESEECMEYFQMMDAEYCFYYYGLLIETNNNKWEIIDE